MSVEVIQTTRNGWHIIKVPLDNSRGHVVVDKSSFDDLLSLGVGLPWRVWKRQVYVRNKGGYLSLARLITNAGPHERIIYLDGDRFNLTRINLVVDKGGPAKSRDRALVVPRMVQVRYKHADGVINANSFNL